MWTFSGTSSSDRARSSSCASRKECNCDDAVLIRPTPAPAVGSHRSSSAQHYPTRCAAFVITTCMIDSFLTNNFDLPAHGRLAQVRWKVELFFKWIKQHLRIKAFYGTSEAVKTQIWICSGRDPQEASRAGQSPPNSTGSERDAVQRAFHDIDSKDPHPSISNQLILFDL